ncbi:MAG: bifunctional diaminohydroxyphosphoribosylaminopyrimidine [Bacteroidota bacterium]|jgi:diaminohydroxyphosphoribosylaminopyrimidine deaminase/5-amino-6-(5-phosphoribosylamino)uracil reductase
MEMTAATHTPFMARCLALASPRLGKVKSNPLVGAVLVQDNEIIGEGCHEFFGGPHAEVNAINSVKNAALLPHATLYVNLEPCVHFGKTPPCASLIVESKIKHVVIGQLDPNPKVNGQGVQFLRDHGIQVTTGILEEECRQLNVRFNTYHEKKRPYLILKWAESMDGFIDPIRKDDTAQSVAISSKPSRTLVHQWRSQEMGILVGINTVLKDNPQLDVRWHVGDSPIRLILDPHLKSIRHPELQIWNGRVRTIVFHHQSLYHSLMEGAELITCTEEHFLQDVMNYLHQNQIISILVEGGAITHQHFMKQQLFDEIRQFVSNTQLHDGVHAPKIAHSAMVSESIIEGGDQLNIYHPTF